MFRANIFILSVLLFPSAAAAQYFVMPSFAQGDPGLTRSFQLLRQDGTQITNVRWSSPEADDVTIDGSKNGLATVAFKTPGWKVIQGEYEGQRASAKIKIFGPAEKVRGTIDWAFEPLNGDFSNVLHAWYGTTNPSYYYEDRGTDRTQVRAINKDGTQAWIWPVPAVSDRVRMLCGDTLGGVIVIVGDRASRRVVALDSAGTESWRISAPGFPGSRAFTSTQNGDFYFLQEDPDRTSVRLNVLNGKTGVLLRSIELPESRSIYRNLRIQNGKLVCSPNSERTQRLPLSHSDLFTDIDGTVHIVFTESSLVAEAGTCASGTLLPDANVKVIYTQKLVMLLSPAGGDFRYQTVEENRAETSAHDVVLVSSSPTGDIIPDQTGIGSFFAIRRTTQHWPAGAVSEPQEFQYRVTNDGELRLRAKLPATTTVRHTTMLLGDANRTGLTSRGNQLIVFDTESGKELWRWTAETDRIELLAALANGGVVVREGKEYKEVNSKGVQQIYPEEMFIFQEHWKVAPREED